MKSKQGKYAKKYIVVLGGVLSGIGKGITASSLGALLNCAGLKISMQKLEPYLNVDSGTLSPGEHGECFVTHDGKETDLDLGHYERFTGVEMNKNSVTLSGGVLQELLERERAGKYLGKNVQMVPHQTNLIKEKILQAGESSDVHIIEIGGTVGDYEALSFIESVRELSQEMGRENFIFVQVCYVPFLKVSGEFKTKPLQNAVRDLRHYGIVPDLIMARCEETPKNNYIERKTAPFVGVSEDQIVVLPNADTIYRVPVTLYNKGIGNFMLNKFGYKGKKINIAKWKKVVDVATTENSKRIKVAIVGKYLDNLDTYYSVIESLKIASWHAKVSLKYDFVDSEKLEGKSEDEANQILRDFDGILVPGGFGKRGVEGKIKASDFAFVERVPYIGICLGLQVAVIAAARRAGLVKANSEEFDNKTSENVVYIMPDQVGKVGTGGTMRLGTYECIVKENSLAMKIFNSKKILERHRHRYEVNQNFLEQISKGGVVVSGTSPNNLLVELVEADKQKKHPFYLATQSHPEFLSRPWNPHPMFLGFVEACKNRK